MTSVASRFMNVDPHMKNAYSAKNDDSLLKDDDFDVAVKFDISHKSGQSNGLREGRKGEIGEAMEVAIKKTAPQGWELDVRGLISSRKWLQNYGLKKNRLHLNQILPSIGFKLSDEFDESLKKPVSSRYGGGLFRHLMRTDGKTFNISCTKDKLIQLEKRLLQAIYLFRRRLEWLTTESRRVFGIIEERAVTIVLDIRNMSPQQFDQYRTALERVLREQVSQLAKFNLIRASEDIQKYSPECVPVSHDTLENAVQWMWNLDRLAPVANTSCAEAILMALQDKHNEAVYLFTEGTSVDSGKEVLKEKVSNARIKAPVNVVSFNCDSSETIKFLKDFVATTAGKFHAYAVVMELDAYEAQPPDGVSNKANILLRRKTFGGIPPGAGVREDVVLVFEEMEEARNNLAQVRMLLENAPEPSRGSKDDDGEAPRSISSRDEQYMSSQQWLEIYGLDARKLALYDVLSGVAFKHLDGIVDMMQKPPEDSHTDAIVQQKLVNARYCERFPVVRWKDGSVVHVQVTPEVHRGYEERVMVTMNKIHQRIDWLNKGSRALFGTLVEDQIYILIDTSASMQPSLTFVKQKLFVLMQEQLRHKKKFNIITFNSKAVGWKDRLVDVTERSLQSAWSWVQNLSCWGSTNTYGAIQLAMADPQTQAIYLLTDGRPDQPPKSVLAQVEMRQKIPIHTISFNCNDTEANQFLFDLSEVTGGRYHYYSEGGKPVDQPESWESVDIKLLKDEIKRGFENLEKLAGLRDECTSLGWKKEKENLRKSIEAVRESTEGMRKSAMPPLDSKDIYRPNTPPRPPSSTPPPRPSSAGPARSRTPLMIGSPRGSTSEMLQATSPSPRPTSAHGVRTGDGLRTRLPKRPKSAKVSISRKPMIAGHTRTSLLRTLSSSGRFSPNEWLLPETKQLFQLQAERQTELAKRNEKKEQVRNKRTKKLIKASEMSSKQWLAKHGLVAKRLTILDALGSTFVPHKPKYVSILDKYVMSKVFDEILPIAHVSKNQHVRLVNPNGVNLREYEKKLKAALEKYRAHLNKFVWDALPEDAKKDFESDGPVDFQDNSKKLLALLDEADWPIREQDIVLLTNEICRGEKFLHQSQALRKAAECDSEDNSGEEENNSMDMPLISNRSEKSERSNRSKSNKSDASPPRSEPAYSEQGSKDQEGLGQVIRSVDKSKDGRVKESAETIKTKVRIKLDTLRGQRVIARKDQDGLYYPGAVLKCTDPRHASIKYDDGSVANILTRNLIPTGGAVARPVLTAGDYVLMRVVNLDSNDECYVPAVVQFGPQKSESQAKFYSVVMYNGQKASTLRTYLVKISKERFELCSMYIRDQMMEHKKDAEEKVYVSPRKKYESDEEDDDNDDSKVEAPRKESYSKQKKKYPQKVYGRSQRKFQEKKKIKEVSRKARYSSDEERKSEEDRRSYSDDDEDYDRKADRRKSVSDDDRRLVDEDASFFDNNPREKEKKRKSNEAGEEVDDYADEEFEDESNKKSDDKRRSDDNSDEGIEEEGTPRIPSSSRDRTPRSEGSGRSEVERLRQELLNQQKKQDRERKKLRRKAKKLSRKEREVNRLLRESEEAVAAATEPVMTPRILHLRKSLEHVRPGEEVLARWSDDGWYYRGIVRHYHGDCSYNVEDSTGFIERIWREDMISENDNPGHVFEIDQKVVALHPDYSFSYAPGFITNVNDSEVEVEFFDHQTALLPWNEVYHSDPEKYEEDVRYISQKEDELVGAAVVARDDKSGAYYPGTVKKKNKNLREYVISWSEGTESLQKAIHIFSAFTRKPPLTAGDKVLALVDPVHVKFLPGYLTGSNGDKLMVTFCNGERRNDVDPSLCYWLGQMYYNAAVKYFKTHDPSFY